MSKAYPSNLTLDQFELISGLIPTPKPGGRPRNGLVQLDCASSSATQRTQGICLAAQALGGGANLRLASLVPAIE